MIGFGLFFVFAEKQAPEFKLRNFKKTATKPMSIAHRLSSISSRNSSTQVRQDSAISSRLQGQKYDCFSKKSGGGGV